MVERHVDEIRWSLTFLNEENGLCTEAHQLAICLEAEFLDKLCPRGSHIGDGQHGMHAA